MRLLAPPLAVLGLLAGSCLSSALAESNPATREWPFDVKLDGKPIGHHRFTVQSEGQRTSVLNEARFNVKILGISVYRYQLDVTEQWTGDCLHKLQSQTNDDGERLAVRAERDGNLLRVRGGKAPVDTSACVRSYAYWNPKALRQQSQLLNPQTGVMDAVSVREAGESQITIGDQRVPARRLRIAAPPGDIDMWLSPDGEWIGLDAKVEGGRTVQYRLRSWPTWLPRTDRPQALEQTAASRGAQP